MDKIIFINNCEETDHCAGEQYHAFISYAFARTDYFMLVYINYYGKGYSRKVKEFKKKLEPYKIKSRSNPSWPGPFKTECRDTTYKIVFYRCCKEAKAILDEVNSISIWSRPSYPEDLAFFEGNQCWFYSVGHENIAAVIHATEQDLIFLEENGIAERGKAYQPNCEEMDFYRQCDEDFSNLK